MITVGASAYSRVDRLRPDGRDRAGRRRPPLRRHRPHRRASSSPGHHPSPVPHADFVTTTTHKTLRGPRGGLILCKAAHAKALDSAVFPGRPGRPAHARHRRQGRVLRRVPEARVQGLLGARSSRTRAPSRPPCPSRGYRIVSGGTDNHLLLADLRSNLPELTAKKAQETLDLANITCNKNTVPFETRSPFQASGIRLGTPAVTTRGLVESDMDEIAG